MWRFETHVALENVRIADGMFGATRMLANIKIGDLNFDGKKDILFMDGETGTLNLFEAKETSKQKWSPTSGLNRFLDTILFPVIGTKLLTSHGEEPGIKFVRTPRCDVLKQMDDPQIALFFDVDESGRQDILVTQRHGTRLLSSNFKDYHDAVFFKATSVEVARESRHSRSTKEGYSPIAGNTFEIAYGGRYGREVHVCSHCPQSGFFALESCSCMFGIMRIANYIEEMGLGGVKGVRTWRNLMPNAVAIVWPRKIASRRLPKWKIAYVSKGRDGKMKRIVVVLFATLLLLMVAILYSHGQERMEESHNKLDFGFT